ncbi:hypothetical protein OROMI_011751 [Orobanche minor]
MEEDKKKRKINKKKKKKKNATEQTESVTLDATESTSDSQSRVLEIEQNANGQVSGVIDSSNDVGGHIVDKGGNHANNSEGTSLAEKHYWLDREKIKELEAEKDAQIQKESFLEVKIKQLLKENAENAQKEASEREKVEKLRDEKNASMQNEARLKEKLMQLEKEKDALSHNEDIIEQKILQLQKEVEVHMQKEARLETKFLQLEGEKSCWVQKEISAKESVISLTNENTKLHAQAFQVIELEQSRESLLEENQQLSQTVSSLQLQINNLKSAAVSRYSSVNNKVTSEDGDVNYQIETEGTLVDRLMMENSELVEKVNELYAELDRRGLRREQFSTTGDVANQSADSSILVPDLAYGFNSHHITDQATDSISEASKILPVSDSGQFWQSVVAEDQRSSEIVEVNDGRGLANTSEIIEDDEIVQISLDESEFKENKLGAPQDDEKTDVLLSDAPLIGAPFRLISFVARYVSGADLVDKNTGK